MSKSKLGIVSQRHAKGWPGLETFVLLRQLHLSMGWGGSVLTGLPPVVDTIRLEIPFHKQVSKGSKWLTLQQ